MSANKPETASKRRQLALQKYAMSRAAYLTEEGSKSVSQKCDDVDVDVVVLWVEDSREHRDIRNAHAASINKGIFDNQETRFRCNQELRYCLRSIFWCMKWVRRVHVVVADYQYPTNFIDPALLENAPGCPEIRVIPHSIIMAPGDLPTFNSQAIEAKLHHIPGLAERFVYFNDDFMLGRPLPKSFFYTQDKAAVPCYNFDQSMVPDRKKHPSMSQHAQAWCNNSKVLTKLFGEPIGDGRLYPSHVAVPMLKSSFSQVWKIPLVQKLLARTSSSKFRKSFNLYIIGFLVYWNLYRRGAKTHTSSDCFFHDLEEGDDAVGLCKYLMRSTPGLFCINDGAYTSKERGPMKKTMNAMYPLRTPWEPKTSRS